MALKALSTLLLTLTLLSFITVRSSARTPLPTPKPAPISPAIAPSVPPPSRSPSPPPTHSPSPSPPTHSPPPPTSSFPPPPARCPVDIAKLSLCHSVLNVGIIIGPQRTQCCSLIDGLVDLDAAACLCTAIKANVLGAVVDVRAAVSVILNSCRGKDNSGFICN